MVDVFIKDAVISPRGRYRYLLTRYISNSPKQLVFGYGKVSVVNLFAFRATDPSELLTAHDPIGAENAKYIKDTVEKADLTICAWGTKGSINNQDKVVLELLKHSRLHALKISKRGYPCHPLYLKSDLKPFVFN